MARSTVRRRRWPWVLLVLTALAAGFVVVGAYRSRDENAVAANAALDLTYVALGGELDGLGVLAHGFDVDSHGNVLLAPQTGGLVIIGDDGDLDREPVGGRRFESAAFDGDTILATSGGYFGRLNARGQFDEGVPLPYNDARLFRTVDPGTVYLVGAYRGEWRIYRFAEHGDYRIVFASDEAIVAVADGPKAIWAATPTRILKLDATGVQSAFVAPKDPAFGPITGLAISPNGDPIIATDHAVWIADSRGDADTLVNNAGGELRQRGPRTYVLDRKRSILFYFADKRGKRT
jgi:hypothetical protein